MALTKREKMMLGVFTSCICIVLVLYLQNFTYTGSSKQFYLKGYDRCDYSGSIGSLDLFTCYKNEHGINIVVTDIIVKDHEIIDREDMYRSGFDEEI